MTESSAPSMKDSGERRTFETGAVRDRGQFKPRPDLISPHANLREGAWLEVGAKKYKPRNWEAGMPISECVASLCRHLEAYKLGLRDEDHMAAIRTNAGFILHFEEEIKAGRLPASLDDMPLYVLRDRMEVMPGTRRINPLTGSHEVYMKMSDFSGPVPPDDPTTRVELDPVQAMCDGMDIHGPLDRSAKPFTVYLCGPITGFTRDYDWRYEATQALAKHGIKTLDPLRGKKQGDVSNDGLSYKGQLAAPEIAERDRLDIEEADVIFAHFPYDPPRQSIGSLMEMGAAAIGYKKTVILCTSVPVFNDHLFCRNFCTLEQDFKQALRRIVALSHVAKRA